MQHMVVSNLATCSCLEVPYPGNHADLYQLLKPNIIRLLRVQRSPSGAETTQ